MSFLGLPSSWCQKIPLIKSINASIRIPRSIPSQRFSPLSESTPGDRRQAGQSLQCRSFPWSKCLQHPCRITGHRCRGMASPSKLGRVWKWCQTGLPNLGKSWEWEKDIKKDVEKAAGRVVKMNVYNEMPTLRQNIELQPLPQRSIPQLLSFAYLSTWGKSLNQSRKPCKHWTALQNSPNGSLGYFATVRHCCMTHCRWHWTSFSISRNLCGTPTLVLHSSGFLVGGESVWCSVNVNVDMFLFLYIYTYIYICDTSIDFCFDLDILPLELVLTYAYI